MFHHFHFWSSHLWHVRSNKFDVGQQLHKKDPNKKKAISERFAKSVEYMMETVKHEMDFLANVDKPGSAVDVYVDELDAILAERAEDVARLRARVDRFRSLLAQEESLSARVLATETT